MAQYKTLNNFANEFSTSTTYNVGDLVMYQGILYRCTTSHSGSWNASNFTQSNIKDAVDNGGGSGSSVTASNIDSETATAGQVLTANGSGGASWQGLPNDKPIHFIKLTSLTLTEALRSEILSDDYVVVLEYNNNTYYECGGNSYYKDFENPVNISEGGPSGYDRYITMVYNVILINVDSLAINFRTVTRSTVSRGQNNISNILINSKTNDSTSVSAGKVLTANGSGGTSWESTIPTVEIVLTQVVSQDPLQIQLTNDQYNVFANNKQVIIDFTAVEATAPVVVWDYADEDSNEIIFGYADTDGTNSYSNFVSINKSTKIGTQSVFEKNVSIEAVGDGHSADTGKLLGFDSSGYGVATNNLPILTTAPTEANTEGGIKIVVLSQEPAQKFSGFLYLILGA